MFKILLWSYTQNLMPIDFSKNIQTQNHIQGSARHKEGLDLKYKHDKALSCEKE